MTLTGHVAIITHGGERIGLGHVTRCLALARALRDEGAAVRFVVSPGPEVTAIIEHAGFDVSQSEWESNPAAGAKVIREQAVETVVVDAYTARTEHFEALKQVAAQLVAIDDMGGRRLPVDMIVNMGAGTEGLRYEAATETMLLLGSRYALLDPAYAAPPVRATRARVARALVTLGGSVHAGALEKAVGAADAALDDARIDVVVGPFGSPQVLDGAAGTGRNHVVAHGALPDLRTLMLEADLAVSGAGVTLSELAATATPVVMVMTEPNQARNVAAFDKSRAAVFAGPAQADDMAERVQAVVRRLAGDADLRAALGAAGRRLVDGQGARRVARELLSLSSPRRCR